MSENVATVCSINGTTIATQTGPAASRDCPEGNGLLVAELSRPVLPRRASRPSARPEPARRAAPSDPIGGHHLGTSANLPVGDCPAAIAERRGRPDLTGTGFWSRQGAVIPAPMGRRAPDPGGGRQDAGEVVLLCQR